MSKSYKERGNVLARNKLNIIFHDMYKMLSTVGFIERYLFKIRKVFMIMYPADEFSVDVKTIKLSLKAWIISGIIFAVSISSGKLHVYGYGIILIMLIVINVELINAGFSKMELKLLRQLEHYLGEVRHYFHMNGVLEDAIYDSLEDAEYEIYLHISHIYEILLDSDKDKTNRYKDIAPNKFFMTFLALCETVMFYGDTIKDGESLFLQNINSLRDEIRTEILKREKINYVFAGLTGMCLIPPFTLKMIEKWGISNIPELKYFYDGKYGLLVSVIIMLSSLGAYGLISRLKESYRYTRKNHDILQRIDNINIVDKVIIKYMFRHPAKVKKLGDKLRRASEDISVKNFLIRRVFIGIGTFIILTLTMVYGNSLVDNDVIPIPRFSAMMLPFPIAVSFFASVIPDIMLDIRMYLLRGSMENEVISFHSIIIMLMHIKRMNVETILEWLENFSEIFKTSLGECVDNYSYCEEDALEHLKEMEPYPPFVRIIENLLASDNVGIEDAFEEIYSQQQYFMEKRKQDNEINIANSGAIARFVSFIPMVVTIGLYLIVPFVIQSLWELMGYAGQISI